MWREMGSYVCDTINYAILYDFMSEILMIRHSCVKYVPHHVYIVHTILYVLYDIVFTLKILYVDIQICIEHTYWLEYSMAI